MSSDAILDKLAALHDAHRDALRRLNDVLADPSANAARLAAVAGEERDARDRLDLLWESVRQEPCVENPERKDMTSTPPSRRTMTMRAVPWLMALMLMATPLALADDDPEDGSREREDEAEGDERKTSRDGEEGHDERDDEERQVRVEVDGLEARIRLERESAAGEDKVAMRYDAADALLEVKYEAEGNDTSSEKKLRARFHEVFEYVDADGDGAYDVGETIASSYLLGGGHEVAAEPATGRATWQPITLSDVTKGNATGKKLESRATFGEGGVFGLVFYVYGDFTLVDGATLQPTEAKIDILVQDYPFVRNDSRVGVALTLKAEESFESDHEFVDEGEQGVAASGSAGDVQFSLVFTWKETALVDGVETPVAATIVKESTDVEDEHEGSSTEQKVLLVLSYARGSDILHDPTAGVSYHAMGAGTTSVPAPGAFAVVAAGAVVAFLARRRRG